MYICIGAAIFFLLDKICLLTSMLLGGDCASLLLPFGATAWVRCDLAENNRLPDLISAAIRQGC